jgi:predicted transposase YdaD
MANEWDDVLKRMIEERREDYLEWLLKGAHYKSSLSIELRNVLRKADLMWSAELHGQNIVVHIEVQSTEDDEMSLRMLDYAVRAARTYYSPVVGFVIYLREASLPEQVPLEWDLYNGRKLLYYDYVVIKIWKLQAAELIEMGLPGLLPLLPLTRDGRRRNVVETMVEHIAQAELWELLSISRTLTSLVFTAEAEKEWVKGIFAMYNDILRESWGYQEILQEGEAKGEAKGRAEERREQIKKQGKLLQKLVQQRYPDLLERARSFVESADDPIQLTQAMLHISAAQNSKQASRALAKPRKSSERSS